MANKRKKTTPKRYESFNRVQKRRQALDQIHKYHLVHHSRNQIKNLTDLTAEANELYHESPLQWPFFLEDSELKSGITKANRENFHMKVNIMQGKPGFSNPMPGNPRSNNQRFQNQLYWLNHNDALQHSFKKHLNVRTNRKAYERLDDHVLRKFRF